MFNIFNNNVKSLNLEHIPSIIFKVDDLENDCSKMRKIVNLSRKEGFKLCLGIIGNSLENPSEKYLNWLRMIIKYDNIELFNHGYIHNRPLEFLERTYEEQKKSIDRTQKIVNEHLGITIHSFGAPENVKDEQTLLAINATPDINTWFFGSNNYSKLSPQRTVYLEKPFPKVSFETVKSGIIKYSNEKIVVLECHPRLWKFYDWYNFKKIIKFLKNNNANFVLPREVINSN